METPSRKRGRPRIVVTEAVAEARRLALQQRNARRARNARPTAGLRKASPGASLSDAGCVPSLAGKHKGGVSALESPRRRNHIDRRKASFASGITVHDIGRPNQVCGYCTAQVWAAEFTGRHIGSGPKGYSICCGTGKVHLPLLREAPPELMALLTGNGGRERKFQQNNRMYNTIFALCSFGGTVDEAINNGSGPYVFRVNLQTYHSIGSLAPPDGRTPKFAQFYMYDGQEAVDYRLGFPRHKNVLDAEVVGILQEMLVRVNALLHIFRQVRERYPLSQQIPVRLRLLERRSGDGRFVNLPGGNDYEFAGLAIDDNFVDKRDILVDYRQTGLKKGYRHVNRDLALTFDHKTEVKPTEDTGRLPQFYFNLTEFEAVPALLWATDNFIEVIGMVREIGALELASNGAKKGISYWQQQMLVTLWEDKAAQFQEGLTATEGAAAFVVITGLLAKQYSGPDIVLSSGDGTKTYFNIEYKPLQELRENIIATTTESGGTMLPPTEKLFVSTVKNALNEGTIRNILDVELSEESQVLRFLCQATIVAVSNDANWYYDSCPKCPKKIRIEEDKFFCDNCKVETKCYKERYMVTVSVKDDSGKTTFTLFNKEVERLLGIPIDNLVADIGQANLTQDLPPVLNNIVGKKCAFHVKVNSYNQGGRAGYTVARLSEIDTPAPNIQPPKPSDEPGPSKKHKTA